MTPIADELDRRKGQYLMAALPCGAVALTIVAMTVLTSTVSNRHSGSSSSVWTINIWADLLYLSLIPDKLMSMQIIQVCSSLAR